MKREQPGILEAPRSPSCRSSAWRPARHRRMAICSSRNNSGGRTQDLGAGRPRTVRPDGIAGTHSDRYPRVRHPGPCTRFCSVCCAARFTAAQASVALTMWSGRCESTLRIAHAAPVGPFALWPRRLPLPTDVTGVAERWTTPMSRPPVAATRRPPCENEHEIQTWCSGASLR